jgi:hypothetical protein
MPLCPFIKHNMKTKLPGFMGWSKHKTKYPSYNVTMPKQELMTCLLPSPKGTWKHGPRYKFSRRFWVGMSGKSSWWEFQVKISRSVGGRQERGGEELHCASLCLWLQYVLEIYSLHNCSDLLCLNNGGPYLSCIWTNFSPYSSVALSSFGLNNVLHVEIVHCICCFFFTSDIYSSSTKF